ncbi:LysR family transcriptional regulator [Amycolatopsis cihanbeyliensis]|uniref:DNA-binding transcriptional LysR family regulator n=1 Tax=Amycolatopsis cihanbeyliensis TaxID=1128664 RepID=A0A542DC09_AMYCI|nr:LysR family transcriptional regulator [Amycolatopsis cihanbeyliensis]TQJ00611.1 DNA-binding transcriptional LysR family regulator [Amycolatopsis cihanbeyliensis]
MSVIDLHRLEQLIAVAEEGSVTKAAARLHLSQQALSTSLRNLEREVGVDLLDRGGTRIRVLPAGEALIADARVLRGLARSALRRARRIGRGEPDVLRVGHTPAVPGEELGTLIRTVHRFVPGLRIEPHQHYPSALTDRLLDGELDIGLCRAMLPVHGLTRTTLTRHRLSIAVGEHHRLARREDVTLAELAEETIVVWGHPGRSGYTDLLLTLCRQAGFEPKTVRSELQGVPPSSAVVGTDHVAFVTAPPGATAGGTVRVIDLTPPLYVPLIALWPEHSTSEPRDAFLRTLREALD